MQIHFLNIFDKDLQTDMLA